MTPSQTAFPSLEQDLARAVREAQLDHEALAVPLKTCELTTCRAMCCHDGVYLDAEERTVIHSLIAENREILARYGWAENELFTRRDGRWKSATREEAGKPTGYPAHFPRTRCVFLDAENRCVLQRLAADKGKHPWFWKPVSCWMHPLLFRPGRRPILTLAKRTNDDAAFSSYTPCGIACATGIKASETLRTELDLLGKIGGRDLVAELAAPQV